MRVFVYLITLGVVLSCQQRDSTKMIRIKNFNHEGWKMDSLGCLGIRMNESKKLDEHISHFVGEQYRSIELTLGKPNRLYKEKDRIVAMYFVASGRQCADINWSKHGFFHAEQVMFFLNGDSTATGSTGIIYP